MNAPLLHTKFNIPPLRPDLVPRKRLIEMLDKGASSKLILISAPAGFGKTTLVNAWKKERGNPFAWLSLDTEDNDPTHFLLYAINALKSIAPQAGQASLAMLHSTPQAPLETVLIVLINDLSRIPDDFFLCFSSFSRASITSSFNISSIMLALSISSGSHKGEYDSTSTHKSVGPLAHQFRKRGGSTYLLFQIPFPSKSIISIHFKGSLSS